MIMNGLNKVNVVISGEVFTLVANEEPEYIQKLARYIDKKTRELNGTNSSANINPATRSLLIAINIADDLCKEKERCESLEVSNKALTREIEQEKSINEQLSSEMIKLTMENRNLRERVSKQESRGDSPKRETSDYIELYDSNASNLKTIPMPTSDIKKPYNKGR